MKSGLASAIGQGIPWFLTFSISGATIYLTGSMVNQGKSEPGFVLVVSITLTKTYRMALIVNSDERESIETMMFTRFYEFVSEAHISNEMSQN